MVTDRADYRWSRYGGAIGGGAKGNGKKSREGWVRACLGHQGVGFDAEQWKDASRIYRRLMGIALGRSSGKAEVKSRGVVTKNTAEMLKPEDNQTALPDLKLAGMLLCRVRYLAACWGFVADYLRFAPVHGRRGDRQQGVRERGVHECAGSIRSETQGRRETDAGQRQARRRGSVEPAGAGVTTGIARRRSSQNAAAKNSWESFLEAGRNCHVVGGGRRSNSNLYFARPFLGQTPDNPVGRRPHLDPRIHPTPPASTKCSAAKRILDKAARRAALSVVKGCC